MSYAGHAHLDGTTNKLPVAEHDIPNAGGNGILATVTGINLKVAAQTALYTVPAGKTAIITSIVVRPTTVTTFVGAATISVGRNAGASDIQSLTALTGASTISNYFGLNVAMFAAVVAAAAEVISLNVAVGANAAAFVASVDLVGYLV